MAGLTICYGDFERLYGMFTEIFILRVYAFDAANDRPHIVDAGANIGLATLFFKYQYPHARVTAFEPDPATFDLLRRNVEGNGLQNVDLHNTALLDYDGETPFWVRTDIAAGDIGASTSSEHRYRFHRSEDIGENRVRCERLSPYLAQNVDLLKMDIEGSEERVFAEVGEGLSAVQALTMEYHYLESTNALSTILRVLECTGHRYHLGDPVPGRARGAGYHVLPPTYVLIVRSGKAPGPEAQYLAADGGGQ